MAKLRNFDDKVINILNDEIPTESFYAKKGNPKVICTQLQKELHSYYDSRENAIQKCIEVSQKEIDRVKATDDMSELRDKSRNLRMFKQELDIENINKARSLKAVEERCNKYL